MSSERKEAFECHKCVEIECLNLFNHLEKEKNVGGELYMYTLLGKTMKERYAELNRYVCRNGVLLRITCFLVNPITKLKEKSYLKDVLNQSARDLKTSMFLALSGHYRQAMQVLRCSFENLISGVYFHSDLCQLREKGATEEEFTRLDRRYNNWKKSGRVNVRASLEILRRTGFLNQSEEKDWKELYSDLSKFVHTPEEYVFRVKHKDVLKDVEMVCPSTTYFSEDALRAWSDSFEKVFAAILKAIVEYYLFALGTRSGKIAVKQLRSAEEYFGVPDRTLDRLYQQIVLPHLTTGLSKV